MDRLALEATAELAVREEWLGDAYADALWELIDRGELSEEFNLSALDLTALAKRRRRDPRGRFAAEIAKLKKPGDHFRIGNVTVAHQGIDRRTRRTRITVTKELPHGNQATDAVTTKGQALARALDLSAEDTHPESVGGRKSTTLRQHHEQGLETHRKLGEKELNIDAVGGGPWDAGVEETVRQLSESNEPLKLDTYKLLMAQGGGEMPLERAELHARILDLLFQGTEIPEGRNPDLLFMFGGPAAGKSSILRSGQITHPEKAVVINPDVIKAMLPEYRHLQDFDVETASSHVHEESSYIAGIAAQLAVAHGYDVVVDKVKVDTELSTEADSLNYRRRAVGIFTDPLQAFVDAKVRAKRERRSVPADYFFDAHAEVARRFHRWRATGIEMRLFVRGPSRDVDPKLVAGADAGILQVTDPKAYARFEDQVNAGELEALVPHIPEEAFVERGPDEAQVDLSAVYGMLPQR